MNCTRWNGGVCCSSCCSAVSSSLLTPLWYCKQFNVYATSCPFPPTPYEIDDARYTLPGMISSSLIESITKRFCNAAFKPITYVSMVDDDDDEEEEDDMAVDDIFNNGR